MGFNGTIEATDVFDDAFEFLCSFKDLSNCVRSEPISLSNKANFCLNEAYLPDNSLTNSSSISLIIEMGSSRLLFLGDSWAEDIEEALQSLPKVTFPMIFDAIKISHHGSIHNTSPKLLEMIDAPIFLISSNGNQHAHPDIEVLQAIVDRPADFKRNLHFNYPTNASQKMRDYTSKSGASFVIIEGSNDWINIEGATI